MTTLEDIKNHLHRIEEKVDKQIMFNAQLDDDYFFREAETVVRKQGFASPALLQRELKIGYPRAARLIDVLEQQGVIGPANGTRPRKIIKH